MSPDLLFTTAAVITAIGVLLAAVVSVFKVAKRISDAIGVDSSGRSIADRLDRVEHQLWENGGSSLADRVNRIEGHVEVTASQLHLIEAILLGGIAKNEEKKPSRKPRIKKTDSL